MLQPNFMSLRVYAKISNNFIWQNEHVACVFIKASCTMIRLNQWIQLNWELKADCLSSN